MSDAVLDRARRGDDRAFGALTAPHLAELRLHCYRLLGSLTDAEDVLQETLLAAWRGLAGFEGRSSLRAWLYRIATNRCLNLRRDRARRRPPEPVAPFAVPEPTRRGDLPWLQPCPDDLLDALPDPAPGPAARVSQREALELAFIAGLQRLPPRQAAALILRDVLGFSGAEAAALLDTTPLAVKGALQRARATLGVPSAGDPAPGSAAERALAEAFAAALTAGDVDGMLALLTDDAWLAMPPAPHEYGGRPAIGAFLRASADWHRAAGLTLRLTPLRANGRPAFDGVLTDADGTAVHPAGRVVLGFAGGRIATVTRFLDAGAVLTRR